MQEGFVDVPQEPFAVPVNGDLGNPYPYEGNHPGGSPELSRKAEKLAFKGEYVLNPDPGLLKPGPGCPGFNVLDALLKFSQHFVVLVDVFLEKIVEYVSYASDFGLLKTLGDVFYYLVVEFRRFRGRHHDCVVHQYEQQVGSPDAVLLYVSAPHDELERLGYVPAGLDFLCVNVKRLGVKLKV